jgi:SAM-dependent methyltransferase
MADRGSATPRPRACPLCGGQPKGESYPYGSIWDGKLFNTLACGSCGTAYVDPVPGADEVRRLYERTAYHDCHYQLAAEETQTTALPKVRGLLPQGGDLLDFGCGNGHFLKVAIKAGFRCDGIELDAETRRLAAANSGCEVMPLETVVAEGRRYDVIHLGDVLEHLPDPARALRELEPLLGEDGLFFIEGPLEDNAGLVYFASRTYGAVKKRLRPGHRSDPPLHLLRTGAKAQRQFFERTMGYFVKAFTISDDGWPYRDRDDRWLSPRSPGHLVKMSIAALGTALSRAATPLGFKVGNRFAAVLSRAP